MQAPIRVAVIGLVHDSIWANIRAALQQPLVRLIGAADARETLLQRFQETTRCLADGLYDDARTLLTELKPHAVFCGLPYTEHASLTDLCAELHIALMLEKPMAISLDQADMMVTAVQRSSIPFMVHFPELWNPAIHEAVRLVKDDAIGQVFHVRYRTGHAGPREIGCSDEFVEWLYDPERNGTGAFLDLCCYGAQLCAWIWGKPQSAVGVASTLVKPGLEVPDNAILIMKYAHAFGIAEGTWTEAYSPLASGPSFIGSKGSLSVTGDRLHLVNEENPEGATWPAKPLPKNQGNGVEYFLYCLLHDVPIGAPWDLATSRDAQETLEAGLRSIETGVECPLPVR